VLINDDVELAACTGEAVRVNLHQLHRSSVKTAVIGEGEIADNIPQYLCLHLKSSQGECTATSTAIDIDTIVILSGSSRSVTVGP